MIGKSVWTNFGNSLRFGSVVELKECGTWSYVRVDWKDDGSFEMDRERVKELRGNDRYSDWYRVDKIGFFDKEALITTINKL
jgi:hypothetical protein